MSSHQRTARLGGLSKASVQNSLIESTMDFIWNCLVPWRDDSEREQVDAEEDLNAQLHNFLQARATHEFPMVQFQTEQRQTGRRRVDLSAKPTSAVIICGTYFSIYKPITVIEGKRLPAPDKAREREYITGESEASGGIQRFKLGLHGKDHDVVIMVGYIQKETSVAWYEKINRWLHELATSSPDDWHVGEVLTDFTCDENIEHAQSRSRHPRVKCCKTEFIRIRHFWIGLNRQTRSG
jgi:hypothetical protein